MHSTRPRRQLQRHKCFQPPAHRHVGGTAKCGCVALMHQALLNACMAATRKKNSAATAHQMAPSQHPTTVHASSCTHPHAAAERNLWCGATQHCCRVAGCSDTGPLLPNPPKSCKAMQNYEYGSCHRPWPMSQQAPPACPRPIPLHNCCSALSVNNLCIAMQPLNWLQSV